MIETTDLKVKMHFNNCWLLCTGYCANMPIHNSQQLLKCIYTFWAFRNERFQGIF